MSCLVLALVRGAVGPPRFESRHVVVRPLPKPSIPDPLLRVRILGVNRGAWRSWNERIKREHEPIPVGPESRTTEIHAVVLG